MPLVIDADNLDPEDGFLFSMGSISATGLHKEKRASIAARSAKSAQLAIEHEGSVVVWCDTNYEADQLKEDLPEAYEIRGNDSDASKREKLMAFSSGDCRVLITKPEIAGFGMNWQHCHRQIFAGISFSFERFYQAVRRSHRFGQENDVRVSVVMTDAEQQIYNTVKEKQSHHDTLKTSMADAMGKYQDVKRKTNGSLPYKPNENMELPAWLTTK